MPVTPLSIPAILLYFWYSPQKKQIRSAEENWKIIGSFVQDEPCIHALYPNRGMARDPAKLRDSEIILGRRPTYEPDHERMNIGETELVHIREEPVIKVSRSPVLLVSVLLIS